MLTPDLGNSGESESSGVILQIHGESDGAKENPEKHSVSRGSKQSGRKDLNLRPLHPQDCGLLILAAELNPSKSRFSFELGKASFSTALTYFVHRLQELARITRDSVPNTVPRRNRCTKTDEVGTGDPPVSG